MKVENDAAKMTGPIARDTAPGSNSRTRRDSPDTTPTEQTTDSIETSAVSQQLEADPARLERLRAAVQNGTYSVPAGEVSARIVADHLDRSSKRS